MGDDLAHPRAWYAKGRRTSSVADVGVHVMTYPPVVDMLANGEKIQLSQLSPIWIHISSLQNLILFLQPDTNKIANCDLSH